MSGYLDLGGKIYPDNLDFYCISYNSLIKRRAKQPKKMPDMC